jgi:hypothetical protein
MATMSPAEAGVLAEADRRRVSGSIVISPRTRFP